VDNRNSGAWQSFHPRRGRYYHCKRARVPAVRPRFAHDISSNNSVLLSLQLTTFANPPAAISRAKPSICASESIFYRDRGVFALRLHFARPHRRNLPFAPQDDRSIFDEALPGQPSPQWSVMDLYSGACFDHVSFLGFPGGLTRFARKFTGDHLLMAPQLPRRMSRLTSRPMAPARLRRSSS
jgi:hypothetical protein